MAQASDTRTEGRYPPRIGLLVRALGFSAQRWRDCWNRRRPICSRALAVGVFTLLLEGSTDCSDDNQNQRANQNCEVRRTEDWIWMRRRSCWSTAKP